MSEHRYQPIHKPRKHVSQADMAKTLAKHAQAQMAIKVEKAVESPQAKLLDWNSPIREGHVHVLNSTCGGFAIHASKSGSAWCYECLKQLEAWNTVLGFYPTKEEAMARCEQVARGDAKPELSTADPPFQTPPVSTK